MAAGSVWLELAAAVVAGSASLAAGAACGDELDARHRLQAAGATHTIVFTPGPAGFAVGRHFGLDIVICPRSGGGEPVALRVDAQMPAHRHGMNYRPTVQRLSPWRYRAEGLMFHMAGSWRLTFDLSADGHLSVLAKDLELR